MSDAALKAEYEKVSSALAARSSTVHFAHAAIGTLCGLIAAGTAAKLFWDFGVELYFEGTVAVGVCAVGLLGYSMVRFVLGRRQLKTELTALERLKALRLALGLDDPKALLPS